MWLYTMPDKDGSRRLVDLETDTVIRVIQADRPGAPASIRHFRGHAAGPAPVLGEYPTDQKAAAAMDVLAVRVHAIDMTTLLGLPMPSAIVDAGLPR